MTTITIQLPDEAVKRLNDEAHASGLTLEEYAAKRLSPPSQEAVVASENHSQQIDKIIDEDIDALRRLA